MTHHAPDMEGDSATRPLGRALLGLLSVASVLVLVAGAQLFVLTDHTDRWFAWTIGAPLTAATLGGFYWASFVTVRLAMRERTWAAARASLLGVLAFTILTMAATLIHLGTFHLSEGPASAVAAGWAWLIVYVTVPPAFLFLVVLVFARPDEPVPAPRSAAFPRWFRAYVLLLGAAFTAFGVILFLAPGAAEDFWPWALTALTSRAVAAWLVGVGVTMVLTGWDGDRRRSHGPMVTAVVLGPLLLVAVARYGGDVDWGRPGAWGYVVAMLLVLAMGVAGLLLERRAAIATGADERAARIRRSAKVQP